MRFRCPDCGATAQRDAYPAPKCYECLEPALYTTATYAVTGSVKHAARAMEVCS